MEDLKFRTWDKRNKNWVYFTLDKLVNINHESPTDVDMTLMELLYVGRYTGFTDKFGKEIYDGDIINGTLHVVKYNKDTGEYDDKWVDVNNITVMCYIYGTSPFSHFYFKYNDIVSFDIEVVGNKYDVEE